MTERLLGGLLPARWAVPVWRPAGEQLILINWLYTEIDPRGEERWPILRELRGWRNIEVHEIVVGINSLDWTARIFTEADIARANADFRGAKEWAAAQTSRWQAVAWARNR
jgi:hypothetical protein